MSLSNIIEFAKYNCVKKDTFDTTTIYSNYDSQYPTKRLISNQGYHVEDLYIKSGFSRIALFIFCLMLVNTLLEWTK